MGYLRPTAIIVSGWNEALDRAHDEALRVFSEREMETLVSPIVHGVANRERSFLVAWDGSKEGWAPSDRADEARAELVGWLRKQAYSDRSSPLDWVELQYGGDDGIVRPLAHDRDFGDDGDA